MAELRECNGNHSGFGRALSAARSSAWNLVCVLLLGAAACGDAATDDGTDAGAGALVQRAVGVEYGPWSTPINVTAVNSPAQDNQPTLSPDQLSLYFASPRPGGLGGNDIWVSRRASLDSAWGSPTNLGPPVNSAYNDQGPTLSNDGLLLFFHSNRPGGRGEQDIYVSRRALRYDDFDWDPPLNLGADVNTAGFEAGPLYLQQLEDGCTNFYFARGPTASDNDIYSAAITRDGRTLGPAVPVAALNFALAGVLDARATVRTDGKELLFFSTRPGGQGLADLYSSVRQASYFPWSEPSNLGASINTEFTDTQPSLSHDGRTLLFSSNRPGGAGNNDIWMTTRSFAPAGAAP